MKELKKNDVDKFWYLKPFDLFNLESSLVQIL